MFGKEISRKNIQVVYVMYVCMSLVEDIIGNACVQRIHGCACFKKGISEKIIISSFSPFSHDFDFEQCKHQVRTNNNKEEYKTMIMLNSGCMMITMIFLEMICGASFLINKFSSFKFFFSSYFFLPSEFPLFHTQTQWWCFFWTECVSFTHSHGQLESRKETILYTRIIGSYDQ